MSMTSPYLYPNYPLIALQVRIVKISPDFTNCPHLAPLLGLFLSLSLLFLVLGLHPLKQELGVDGGALEQVKEAIVSLLFHHVPQFISLQVTQREGILKGRRC